MKDINVSCIVTGCVLIISIMHFNHIYMQSLFINDIMTSDMLSLLCQSDNTFVVLVKNIHMVFN